MSSNTHQGPLAGPGVMLLSAAIFGYFGFGIGLTDRGPANEFVFMFALLLWTLRLSAIGFLTSGVLAVLSPRAGNLAYIVCSGVSAVAIGVVGVMDIADQQYASAMPPFVALVISAWHIWSVAGGIRDWRAERVAGRSEAGAARGV